MNLKKNILAWYERPTVTQRNSNGDPQERVFKLVRPYIT